MVRVAPNSALLDDDYAYDSDKHDEYKTDAYKPTETYSSNEHKATDYKATQTGEIHYTATPTHY